MLDYSRGIVVLDPTNRDFMPATDVEGASTAAAARVHPSASRLQNFAEPYLSTGAHSCRSITLANGFHREGGDNAQETNLWRLLAVHLEDCERTPSYRPDMIGLPNVQRHRRWYISHGAHIQDLLQRNALLRRMCITLRWLEEIYTPPISSLTSRVRSTATDEEAVLLRRVIFAHIRGGEHARALQAAEVARDAFYSITLATAQVQTAFERWHNHTAQVPLFGEYGNGEGDFACNEHRLKNLGELYSDCQTLQQKPTSLTAAEQLDLAIAGALSGHSSLVSYCEGGEGSWRDVLWAILRRALVFTTNKAVATGGGGVEASRSDFLTAIEKESRLPSATDDSGVTATMSSFDIVESWDRVLAKKALDAVNELLCRHIQSYTESLGPVSAEVLQMRTILFFLNSALDVGRDDTRSRWLAIKTTSAADLSVDDVRRAAHWLLLMDAAHRENLIHAPLQESSLFTKLVSWHAAQLALAGGDLPLRHSVEYVVGTSLRLQQASNRAAVYAAFVKAARQRSVAAALEPLAMEQQDHELLQSIRAADPDRSMYQHLCTLLEDGLNSGDIPLATELAVVDLVAYRLMATVDRNTIRSIVSSGLQLCLDLSREGLFDALSSAVRILLQYGAAALRTTVPADSSSSNSSSGGGRTPLTFDLPPAQLHELFFWEHVVRVRLTSVEHMRSVSRYSLKERDGDHSAAFAESQHELLQRGALLDATRQVLQQLRGPARELGSRYPQDIAACAAWACRTFVESMILTSAMANARSDMVLLGLQHAFHLVEELDQLSLLERGITPQSSAKALFEEVATLRRLYGQMITRENVAAKLST